MATRKYTHNTEIDAPSPFNCDSKSYKGGGGGGGTDTILYSQHATKIGSHTARGTIPNITVTDMCGPGFELNLFWKSNLYLISFLLIFITRFSGN